MWPKLASLRRITSGGRYIPEIDGLRFVAISSVVLFHVMEMSRILLNLHIPPLGPQSLASQFFNHGDRGVEVFFAISGMVLGLPFARHRLHAQPPVRLKGYLLRRVTRLEPPYIVNLLMRLPLVAAIRHLSVRQAATHLAVSLVYADWLVYRTMPIVHLPSWSLAIEVQFYLLAPLLAVALFHGNPWARCLLSFAFILFGSYLSAHAPGQPLQGLLRLSLLAFIQFFVAGMLAADFYLTLQPHLRVSVLWDVLGIPLWASVFLLPDPIAVYVLPFLLLVLIPAAFLGPALGAFFRAPFVATVGGMCYSIYLTHSLVLQAVFAVLAKLLPHSGLWTLFTVSTAIALPLVLAFGTLFFVWIERPCMDKYWPAKLRAWLKTKLGAKAARNHSV